jgi:hypothetical protein
LPQWAIGRQSDGWYNLKMERVGSARPRPAPQLTEVELRTRLEAGGYRLEAGTGHSGIGFVVFNQNDYVVFGMRPTPYSASLEAVASFIKAQEL